MQGQSRSSESFVFTPTTGMFRKSHLKVLTTKEDFNRSPPPDCYFPPSLGILCHLSLVLIALCLFLIILTEISLPNKKAITAMLVPEKHIYKTG